MFVRKLLKILSIDQNYLGGENFKFINKEF